MRDAEDKTVFRQLEQSDATGQLDSRNTDRFFIDPPHIPTILFLHEIKWLDDYVVFPPTPPRNMGNERQHSLSTCVSGNQNHFVRMLGDTVSKLDPKHVTVPEMSLSR